MDAEVLKQGDESGNRMVVKYTIANGVIVYGIGVPQTWQTSLGPTWSYVVEGDKLTLVDTGCNGSIQHLEEGLDWIGYPLSAVQRIIVTHGHMDHDGNCVQVIARSGAELWAHEVYGQLVGLARWEMDMEWRLRYKGFPLPQDRPFLDRIQEHEELGKSLSVTGLVTDGLSKDGMTFFYTPGHSPDEICILYDRVLFSGDHILPQITPHPSVGSSYGRYRDLLPTGYQSGNHYYGLRPYIKSLKKVATVGKNIHVLPAHRAYYRGKFNMIGLERVQEIVDHHKQRCHDLLELVRGGATDLASITAGLFRGQELDGPNAHLAFTEALSHVEFLQETGDLEMGRDDGTLILCTGTESFEQVIEEL